MLLQIKPTYVLTAYHVVRGRSNDELAIAWFMYPGAGIAGVRIEHIDPGLDLAVLRATDNADQATIALFGGPQVLPVGTSVAAHGFPLQPEPEFTKGSGSLHTALRLATGYISSPDARVIIAGRQVIQYETTLWCHEGYSGGALFDVQGRVVGMIRDTIKHRGAEAPYSSAIRNAEILSCLDRWRISYSKA